MKEHEFIELLNLYVDHEISAEDAARLEAEVAANPERRRIYRQYCQMDRACAQLAEQFHGTVPTSRTVVARARPRRSWATAAYAAGLAVAACVAAVAILRTRTGSPAPAALAKADAPAEQRVILDQVRARAALASYDRQLQPVLTVHDLFLDNADGAAAALPVSFMTVANQNDPLAWIARMQAASVPATPSGRFIFSPSPALSAPDTRSPGRQGQGLQVPAEMAAFRFQR